MNATVDISFPDALLEEIDAEARRESRGSVCNGDWKRCLRWAMRTVGF